MVSNDLTKKSNKNPVLWALLIFFLVIILLAGMVGPLILILGILAVQRPKRRLVGICGIILGFAIGLITFSPDNLTAKIRSKESRAKSDMRTMAIALEAYYVDWNHYPDSTFEPKEKLWGSISDPDQPGFRLNSDGAFPLIAYLETNHGYSEAKPYEWSVPVDPLAKTKSTFSYFTGNKKPFWILWTSDPSGHYALNKKIYANCSTRIGASSIMTCSQI